MIDRALALVAENPLTTGVAALFAVVSLWVISVLIREEHDRRVDEYARLRQMADKLRAELWKGDHVDPD